MTTNTRFTGWHMTIILVAFFAIVILVNIVMATLAVRSFGGKVVENSYVASQQFNGWLEQARRQDRLGWRSAIALTPARHVRLTVHSAESAPVTAARVSAMAVHPLGRAPDVALSFRETAPGTYEATGALPQGRWQLNVRIEAQGARKLILQELR